MVYNKAIFIYIPIIITRKNVMEIKLELFFQFTLILAIKDNDVFNTAYKIPRSFKLRVIG